MGRFLGLLLLCSSVAGAFQAAEPPKKDKCAVAGVVLEAATGKPLSKADVSLPAWGSTRPGGRSTFTDAAGKFDFEDVAPGTYSLMVRLSGFGTRIYRAGGSRSRGTPLTLAPGQEVRDLVLQMTPGAAITGRVLNEDGEPVAGMLVTAQAETYRRGKRQYVPATMALTHEEGKYRLEDLKPGYYVVSAGTLGPLDAHRDERDRTGARLYPLTYYPNAGGIASAATVTVIEDTETSGVDIRVTRTPAFALKGKVVGAPPEGIAGLGLGFHGQTPGFAQLTAPKPDGSFEYPAVAPGSYWLSIFPMHAGGLASVLMPIEVTDHEIEDIALVYAPYVELAGRIVMDSEKAPPKDVTITADPEDSTFSVDAAAAEDGSFTLKRLHRAVYAVGLKGLAGAYVKSMRYQGREVSESGVDLNAGAADTLQITLRSAGAQVSGVAQDEDHKPVPGAAVALVSDSGRHLVFKTAIADQHGAFRIQGVAPGDYKTVAVEDIDPASLEDPQVFQRFAGRAEKLALKENDRKELSLTVAR